MSQVPGEKTSGPSTTVSGVLHVVLYAVARLVLVVAVSGVIYGSARLLGVADFPVELAILFGLVVAMPLGMWVFGPLRRRATTALEVSGERRRRERDQLRARLRGEVPPDQESDPESQGPQGQ